MGSIIGHANILNKVLLVVEEVGPLPVGERVYCFYVGDRYFWVNTSRDILGVREFKLSRELLRCFETL